MGNLFRIFKEEATRSIARRLVLLFVLGIIFCVAFILLKRDEHKEELTISKTESIVTEIQKISEYTTMCYFEEIALKYEKSSKMAQKSNELIQKINPNSDSKLFEDELVMIAKGKVRAGFDLSKVSKEDLVVNNDTLIVIMPKAQIFDIIINPSDFEVYYESGHWDHKDMVKKEMDAKKVIKKDALDYGILKKAEESGVEKLQTFFKAFGFEYVEIKYR